MAIGIYPNDRHRIITLASSSRISRASFKTSPSGKLRKPKVQSPTTNPQIEAVSVRDFRYASAGVLALVE
jgi:hypothetical protein